MIHHPYVEVDLIDHCNLRCHQCCQMAPYLPPRIYDLEQFRKDINALAEVFHLDDHVKFVGGEPFLVPNFAEYVHVLRDSGITPTIPVITNGAALLSASDEALNAPDCVSVTYYADSPPPILDRVHQGIERLRNVRNNRWVVVSDPRTEFFTSEIDYRINDPQIVQRIWNECWQKNSCTSVADGFVSRCTTGTKKQRYLQAIGRPVELHGRCSIHEPNLEERLRTYLSSPEIPDFCHYCLGCSGKMVPHRQMTPEEVKRHPEDPPLSDLLNF